MTYKATIHGIPPSKSNSYRVGNKRLYKTEQVKNYERSFQLQCIKLRNLNLMHFAISINVYYPNRRSDLDGCFKVILDCLQKINAIKNDNKCLSITANKFIDKYNPRVEIELRPITPQKNQ